MEFISGIQLVWNPKRLHYQIWTCSGDRSINVSDLIAPAVVRPMHTAEAELAHPHTQPAPASSALAVAVDARTV